MKTRRTIWLSALITLVSVFVLAGSTCGDDPCAPRGIIVPGAGVGMAAEGDALCLGQGRSTVETLLGPGGGEQDLGAAGTRVVHASRKISVIYAAGEDRLAAIYLDQGAPATLEGGAGLGSTAAAVKAALGAAGGEDPFLQDWWYPTKGLVVQFEGGKVAAIQVMRPQQSK